MPNSRGHFRSSPWIRALKLLVWVTLPGFLLPHLSWTASPTDSALEQVPTHSVETLSQLRQRLGYVWHSLQAPYGSIQVIVHYLDGDEAWAQSTLQTALSALPVLERLTGVPLPIRYDIQLWEVREADIGLAGQNAREEGIVLAREQDVVIHELAHYWVGSNNLAEHWMAEGLAELYDHLVKLQLQNRPWAPPPLFDVKALHPFDGPLALWQRVDKVDATVQQREVNRFFYGKAFLFWYSLSRVNGPGFVKDLQRWIRSAREPQDSAGLLAFLASHQRRGAPSIWDLYPGWLVEGSYALDHHPHTFEWYLADEDDDGVTNLEEAMTGLNTREKDTDRDGRDDGWELYEGRNPLKPEGARVPADAVWVIPQWTPTSSHRFVRAGDTIRVRAEGYWRMAEPGNEWFGADGLPDDQSPSSRWGELIAQVGWGPDAGRVHRVGRNGTFVADRDGILYFAARGMYKRMGRGGLMVATEGGLQLPLLERGSRRLAQRDTLAQDLREEGVSELELTGEHVTLVLHPNDLAEMVDPNAALRYLDRVYEAYRDMMNDAPYGGRRILINFDVMNRDQIQFSGNSLALTFGLEHLRAVLQFSNASRATWGLTYGLAMPFLEWHQTDRLLEMKATWAMAELMASQFFEQEGAEVPPMEQARVRLRSYRYTLRGPEKLKTDKRLLWTFLNSLRRDYGWAPFRATLQANGTLQTGATVFQTSDVPLEDFLIDFARAAGVNLSDRYQAWGFPLTGRIRQALEPLPAPTTARLRPAPTTPGRPHSG